jgi:diaminohydroxyphosphoribosylaminopyrimidine deaminase/5-amino-6-(5-phosphoribosylamino)uracil reductase
MLARRGARVLTVDTDKRGRVSWGPLLHQLGKMDIMSALVEGGAEVAASALAAKAVDKIVWFFSPKILGGDGVSMVGAMGIETVRGAIGVGRVKYRVLGEEMMVEGCPIYGD